MQKKGTMALLCIEWHLLPPIPCNWTCNPCRALVSSAGQKDTNAQEISMRTKTGGKDDHFANYVMAWERRHPLITEYL